MEFYLFDFIKKLFKIHNWLTLVYIVLNIAIITCIVYLIYQDLNIAIAYGCLLYGFSLFIALSSIGEWLLRKECKCIPFNKKRRKIELQIKESAMYSRIEPLFKEAVEKTLEQKHYLPYDIHLFYTNSSSLNAFALGHKTICITDGLLILSDDEIKGIIGHELGHISNHDTDLLLFVIVGNLIVSIIINIIKIIAYLLMQVFCFMSFMCSLGARKIGIIFNNIGVLIYNTVLKLFNFIIWLWTKTGLLLTSKTKRDQEYAADKFSADLGYKDGLLSFFTKLLNIEKKSKKELNIFSILTSSHPKQKKE